MIKKLQSLYTSVYPLLIYRLILLFVCYAVCRLLFYTFNTDIFPDISYSHLAYLCSSGLVFDLSAIIYINFLYIIAQTIPFKFREGQRYQQIFKAVFIVSNSIFLFFNCVDIAYFRFALRRTTLTVFREFANDANNFDLIIQLLGAYWWVFAIWLVLTSILYFTYGSTSIHLSVSSKRTNIYQTLSMLLVVGLCIIGMRGNLKDLPPIDVNYATLGLDKPIESNIVLNTSFTLIRTVQQKSIQIKDFFPEDHLQQLYTPMHYPEDGQAFSKKNVMIIILESFGKSSIGYYAKQMDSTYIGYTPFLDSLIAQSYGFSRSFANGFASNDAAPAILASIPSLMPGNYVSSIYSNNQIIGIGQLLGEEGYETSFFHGASNGSMRFLEFSKLAGFQHYLGRDEYNNEADFDGCWGIADEPFMQFVAREMGKSKPPFLSVLFTLSSHPPYIIPNKYQNKFPKGTVDIHESIGYADYSLRQFFKSIEQQAWFKNTLFVITADHKSGTSYEKFLTSVGNVSIPIIFYDPSGDLLKGQNNDKVVQQIDIMPSILDHLGYSKPYFSFGNSVFSNKQNGFAISIHNGTYQFIENQYVMNINNDQPVGLYNYELDPLLKTNLLQDTPSGKIDTLFKAFVQQYNNRIITNKTIPERIAP